jgi:methionine biosynthesis protein MetW
MDTLDKRQVDLQILLEWVKPDSRVLDLGCGRGVLLEALQQKCQVQGVGVDIGLDKVTACLRRGVTVYHGSIDQALQSFPDESFETVIFSRTLEVLEHPGSTLREALRVGRTVMVGFINQAWWVNRMNLLLYGRRTINEVLPEVWERTEKLTPFSIRDFETFCQRENIKILRRHCLRGDWKRPCRFAPNLLAGYGLFEVTRS